MDPKDKDYFTFVRDIIDAMERGDYVCDIAPDSPAKDKTAFIVQSQGYPTEDLRIQYPAMLVSTLFLNQLSETEYEQIPHQFEFAVTRYQGGAAFYFRTPDGRKLDFQKAKEGLKTVMDWFTPKPLSVLPTRDADASDAADYVCAGPVPYNKTQFFKGTTSSMGNFHHIDIDMHIIDTPDGVYFAMKKDEYAKLIRNAGLINASGQYQGTLLDGEAKPVLH